MGSSCSGKTSVTEILKKSIDNIVSISMDNFYKGLNDEEKKNPDLYNFDEPNALDIDLFIDCITNLKNGESTYIPVYDFKTHSRTNERLLINPSNIIVIEGILIFSTDKLRDLFDMKVYIDATTSTVIFRRLERDLMERGRDFRSVKNQYKNFVDPSYNKYIKPMKKFCDLVIPNEDDTEFIGIKMLCDTIKYKMSGESKKNSHNN